MSSPSLILTPLKLAVFFLNNIRSKWSLRKNNTPLNRSYRQCGFALPMVLWSIAFLGALILLVIGAVNHWLDQESYAEKAFRARQMALSGYAIARTPNIENDDPALTQGKPEKKEGESFHVLISDETGLINPNIFLSGHDFMIFQQLFKHWGLSEDDIESACDGLFDWQSPTEFHSPHGAKKAEYEAIGLKGYPPNAPFVDAKEMSMVIGFAPVMKAKPNWQKYFSTYNRGKININSCAPEILTDVLGLSKEQAEEFIKMRDGSPGTPGYQGNSNNNTPRIISTKQAATLLGANKDQQLLLQNCFTTTGNIRRIESIGRCEGTEHHLIVILQDGITANILSWQEH